VQDVNQAVVFTREGFIVANALELALELRAAATDLFTQALPGLKKAAQEGDLRAARYVYFTYARKFVPGLNSDDGNPWLKKAAEGGDLFAKGELGTRLAFGLGMKQDQERGLQLLDEASLKDSRLAQKNQASVIIKLNPGRLSPELQGKVYQRLSQAVHNGDESSGSLRAMLVATQFNLPSDKLLELERGARKELGLWVLEPKLDIK